MSARVDGAGAPLVATGSKIGSRIEDYLQKFSVQPLLKSIASSVVRNQPDDPVSFIISELKHWKAPQLAVRLLLQSLSTRTSQRLHPLRLILQRSISPQIVYFLLPAVRIHVFAACGQNFLRQKHPSSAPDRQARLHGELHRARELASCLTRWRIAGNRS